ncbi:MAG TPA: AAA domain-containing protein [Polyangia bacterium]
MPLDDHVALLAELLELERAEERRRFEAAEGELSLEERRARGLVLLDLVAAGARALAGRLVVELRPARAGAEVPASQIGPGALVKVIRRRPGDAEAAPTGVVARCSRAAVGVAFDEPPPDWVESGSVGLALLPSAVTYERQRAALGRLLGGAAPHVRRWREILGGARPPRADPRPGAAPAPRLNPEQNEALCAALTARELCLVHGPPGTGKTTVLVAIVEAAVARGERVLCAAASNLAVDNLLEKLVARGGRVVRLGHVARVAEALVPWTLDELVEASSARGVARELQGEAHGLLAHARKQAARGRSAGHYALARQSRAEAGRLFAEARGRLREARAQVLADAQVVCATCTGADAEQLDDQVFDLAVVDEATQATEPATLLPLLRARRAVLAGDHRQLPPTILSPEAARRGLGRSLFERLIDAHPAAARLLREQHRMHEQIMAFPSAELYAGALRAHPAVARHTLAELCPGAAACGPVEFLDTAGTGFEDELGAESESRRNPQEAALVARRVRRLLDAGLGPAQIAVIAPYDAQVQALRALLPIAGLEINTVDGFQGRESEAVVVSLTRSNREAEVGFLADIRRMNVAITRARRHLLVVGDSATVAAHPFYARFIEYVTAAGGYRSAWEEPS